MKRGRKNTEQGPPTASEHMDFASSLSAKSGGFCLTVQLPSDFVKGTPVLAQLAALEGSPVIQQRPEKLFAWLAWHAHRRSQADAALRWDAEVDAFDVRAPSLARSASNGKNRSTCMGSREEVYDGAGLDSLQAPCCAGGSVPAV